MTTNTSKFKADDYVEVIEDIKEGNIRKGTTWVLEMYSPEEIVTDDDGNVVEEYPAAWVASELNGMRGGFPLPETHIKRITENIPFTVSATVEIELISTVYAKSYEEAMEFAKARPMSLISDRVEAYATTKTAFIE